MSASQIKWASRHDWYIGTVNGAVKVRSDDGRDNVETFTSFAALRTWAGY